MKKYAWTIAELLMALVFIMVISGFLISNFKPNKQSAKINVYATIRNLEKGIIAIDDKYEKLATECTDCCTGDSYDLDNNPTTKCIVDYLPGVTTCPSTCGANRATQCICYKKCPTKCNSLNMEGLTKTIFTGGTAQFCKELVDVMNLKSSNCSATQGSPNLVFANGVEVYGLRSELQYMGKTTDEGKKYAYLDIGIDINGSKGLNKQGVDRFPLRIFAVDNLILPVDCNTTSGKKIFDWRQYDPVLGKDGMVNINLNPYCYKGTNFGKTSGTSCGINFQADDEIITYDTYINKISNGGQMQDKYDKLISYSRPFLNTACGIYRGKYAKFFADSQCGSIAGITDCNKTDQSAICYFVLHQPSAGMSAVVQSVIGTDLESD